MPLPTDQLSPDAQYRMRVVIWAAMLGSIPMYGVIMKMVRPDAASPNPALESALLVAAAAVVATSFGVKSFFFQRARALNNPAMVRVGELIAFSLCEMAALFGLVLWFLAAAPRSFWFLVLAAVGQLLHFPRRAE